MTAKIPTGDVKDAPDAVPVTVGNSELGTSEFETPSAERPEPSDVPETEKSEVAERDVWRAQAEAFLSYFTPPSVLAEPPASVKELADYAYRAGWTKRTDGPLRLAGIWWYRLIGIPVTVWCRYTEWFAQRPGRAMPLLLLVKLLALTSYGSWVVDNVFVPVAHFAAWVLL